MRPCVSSLRVSAPGEERYKAVSIVTEECPVMGQGRRVRGPRREEEATEEEATGEEEGEYTEDPGDEEL